MTNPTDPKPDEEGQDDLLDGLRPNPTGGHQPFGGPSPCSTPAPLPGSLPEPQVPPRPSGAPKLPFTQSVSSPKRRLMLNLDDWWTIVMLGQTFLLFAFNFVLGGFMFGTFVMCVAEAIMVYFGQLRKRTLVWRQNLIAINWFSNITLALMALSVMLDAKMFSFSAFQFLAAFLLLSSLVIELDGIKSIFRKLRS